MINGNDKASGISSLMDNVGYIKGHCRASIEAIVLDNEKRCLAFKKIKFSVPYREVQPGY